jgi:hypothetical protein
MFFAEPQPTESHDEAIIKPRMRNHDTDISILQLSLADACTSFDTSSRPDFLGGYVNTYGKFAQPEVVNANETVGFMN